MKKLFFLMLIILSAVSIRAQQGAVRGFVYSKETGEPVIFTNVYLQQTNFGSTTDENGYFAITQIPAGAYQLQITYLGYDTLREKITIKPGAIITQKYFLTPASYEIEGVNVTARKTVARTETKTSVVKLTPADIQKIPSVGGEPDIAQYLQVLPGVIFTGDQGGQLYIRGGSPIQNKVLLDGLTIYNPFHSIGLFSVFDTDLIRNADVYTGGFGAQFGGRISSVMDITTKDGNKKRISGKLSANTFGANINIEGPLKKQISPDKGSASFIISAKHSYLDQTDDVFYNYASEDGLPFTFTDLYGKLSFNSASGSKINFFGFNFEDNVKNYRSLSDFGWDSRGLGSNFVIIPGQTPVLIEGYVGYSEYEARMSDATTEDRTSSINGFDMGIDFTYISGDNNLKYGVSISGFTTDFYFKNNVERLIQQRENTTELNGYFKGKFILGDVVIEPGIRVQYYASLSELSPEPRLALKWNISDKLRLKMATGLYSQNLISARSNRDVVNLFYGFLSGPDELPARFRDEEITSRLQKATHVIAGIEYDLTDYLSTNIETYYKNFSQLATLNRNKLYDEADYPEAPDYLVKDFAVEQGKAYGVDMTLNYRRKGFTAYLAYSLGYVKREDEFDEYYPYFDRRHNMNLTANYLFGQHEDWEINARWNLGSGFPFTQTQGGYGLITFGEGIQTDYTTVNEQFELLYGAYNEARLSYYHRLDLSISRLFFLGKHSKLKINAGVTNVYNRNNVFFVDRVTNERIDQLPVMPTFGFQLNF
jgi:hypothetical protein